MLTLESLREFTDTFQTHEKNVIREYIQHLFLAGLYQAKGSEKLLFKGGTALRLIFQSPRFSEDLDFTGQGFYHHQEIDDLFLDALSALERTGIHISYKEAKPTTGGYLGLIHYELFGASENMKFEVSLRRGKIVKGEVASIISDLVPPYTLISVPLKTLAFGKMEALLARKKPRDYYDLYFMLRHPGLNKFVNKARMKSVLQNLGSAPINFKTELSVLLPASHHLILRNFKDVLRKEIQKYR